MTPLRQRMLEDMQIRNLAENTQGSYVRHIAGFARYFGRSPDQLGVDDIRAYQLYLTKEKELAASSITVAAALRFLYTVTLKRPWNVERAIPTPNALLLNVPLQLLAYHVALAKGRDIDQPRNLTKSVTVVTARYKPSGWSIQISV